MKKDIEFHRAENIALVIGKKTNELNQDEWFVYIINRNTELIHTVLVTSKGYGQHDGEQRNTSVLRHMIEEVPSEGFALIEPIDPGIFHLTNEFWVSYYIDRQIYDKKFIFVPGSLDEKNLREIEEIGIHGVLHP